MINSKNIKDINLIQFIIKTNELIKILNLNEKEIKFVKSTITSIIIDYESNDFNRLKLATIESLNEELTLYSKIDQSYDFIECLINHREIFKNIEKGDLIDR